MINLSVAISIGASENDGKQRKTRPEDIVAQYLKELIKECEDEHAFVKALKSVNEEGKVCQKKR
jgi:hypothetical protein